MEKYTINGKMQETKLGKEEELFSMIQRRKIRTFLTK